jgi:hypothetical protein
MIPSAIVLWLLVAALGRTAVLRRMDGGLQARRISMLVLGTLRAGLLAVVWGIWIWGVGVAVIVSWPFYLAPLLAMKLGVGPGGALKAAFRSGVVRGKLIEINLVMNIVRIALIVLAMVFSASPLPFSSVETQTFLNCWWGGVGLLYMGMSDYFQVVRSAAYLSLWRAYNFPDSGVARGA